MLIHEPMTMATDYALAAATAALAVLSWRRGARFWALMFFFTALGSFFGGTFHGTAERLWWKPTVYAVGMASFFLVSAATPNRLLQLFALLQFMLYAIWMIGHDSFLWVMVDYGIALVMLVGIEIHAHIRHRTDGALWVIGAVLASVVAAAVQQAPTRWHNDIYHLIQMIAMWLLYVGGVQRKRADAATQVLRTSRSTIPPR